MKTKTIRFSHFYTKLNHTSKSIPTPPQYATLLEVFVCNTEELHPGFIEYDTVYFDEKLNKWKNYPLPPGKILVLLFDSAGFLFTTIRRYTPRKHEYYKNSRGELFKIEIG